MKIIASLEQIVTRDYVYEKLMPIGASVRWHVLTDGVEKCKISDAGSQYRCGRVGRGIQPQSTPQLPPQT